VSLISVAELWEGIVFAHDPASSEQGFREFMVGVNLLGISEEIVKRFGRLRGTLRQQATRVPDLDLLIAATALEYELILLSNNRRHFEKIPGLLLESI
jgi:tRNA(fMet)-specific endonuclease VapC